MPTNTDRIKDAVQPFLDSGEEVLAALTAAPKGRTTAMAAGGIGSMIGQSQVGRVQAKADAVGIRVGSSMAVVLTQHRLLTLDIKISAMGHVTAVKDVMSAVPLAEVDSIEAKRLGLGATLTLTARGGDPIKLECKVGPARELADAFSQAKDG
jgi:hypothetical protein